jgi:hypothetical protein
MYGKTKTKKTNTKGDKHQMCGKTCIKLKQITFIGKYSKTKVK